MIRYCSEETSITASSSPVQVSVSGPFGVHDSLRNGGARSVTADLQPPHPLLRQHAASGPVSADWTRKCVLGGQQIGLHMPLRLNLERELLSNKVLDGIWNVQFFRSVWAVCQVAIWLQISSWEGMKLLNLTISFLVLERTNFYYYF